MEDEEWEEEKILLELVGIDKNILATSNYTLVGLETPTPFLKIENMVFKGYYEESVGTNIFFDNDKIEHENKESYCGHGTKKIIFHRIILEPKELL